jgi:hypothetical protein
MNISSHQQSRAQRLVQSLALLCILLVGITAIAEVNHSHTTLKSSANCAICLAVHHSPGKTASSFQPEFSHAVIYQVVFPNEKPASSLELPFALSVRPPPSV